MPSASLLRRVIRGRVPAVAVLAICWCVVSSGCEDPQRVPYIEPELVNWPATYQGVDGLRLHAFPSGVIEATEALLRRGGSPSLTAELAVHAYVVEHPSEGLIVVGTGLAVDLDAVPFAGGLLSLLFSAQVQPGRPLSEQMRDAGLDPKDVRWVVLPTMRFRDTGSVEEFARAKVVVDRRERRYGGDAGGEYRAEEFDDVAMWQFIDFEESTPIGLLERHQDLFGDGSVSLISMPGSTPGAMIVLLRMPERPVVLAGGIADFEESVRYASKPAVAYDIELWWQNIWRLKRFRELAPELLVVPGEPGGLERAGLASVAVYPAAAAEETPAAAAR